MIKKVTLIRLTALLTFAVMLCATPVATTAQTLSTAGVSSSINYKSINVAQIPEATIKSYAEKIKDAGLTLDEALDQAKQKGATSAQITQLRRRFSKYLSSSTSSSSSSNTETEVQTEELSVKAEPTTTQQKAANADSQVFGYNIFNQESLTFSPNTSLAVGDSYIIGVGDELAVDIYGASDQTYDLTVSNNGTVTISMVGPIKVGGLTVEQARSAIISKLKSIYSDLGGRTKVALRITNATPVSVSVMGEAHAPGTFTVSAASSLFNVLYLCGGPSVNGSYRDIQLIRGGRVIAHLDIYDFLLNGKTDVNPSLADGDIIMIPTYAKRVKVEGQFKRTGLFEAKEGETIEDVIRYAGGFTPEAQSDHIGLYRIGKYTTEYKDVTSPASENVTNGDRITCAAKNTKRVDNTLTIEGAVFSPGVFEYTDGSSLKELIDRAGGLTENAFLSRGVITRLKDDYTLESVNFNVLDAANGAADIKLKAGDVITIASIDDMRQKPTVRIVGQVLNPGTFDYRENLTLGDLIVLAGGLQEFASVKNVEVSRRLSKDDMESQSERSSNYETVTITQDLSLGSASNNFKLEPFDVVYIREFAAARIGGSVDISGAVLATGSFGLTSNATRVTEIIKRCGGFTEMANIDGAHLFRKVKISDTERRIRQLQSNMRGDTTVYYLNRGDETYEFVSLNLRKAIENPGGDEDLILTDGDKIEVPEMAQTVRVMGLVQNPSNTLWNKRWRADDYVAAVGGFSPRAFKRKTYVVHANGESETVRHILFIRIYPKVRPGSEVIVPKKPESGFNLPTAITMSSSIVSMVAVVFALVK